MALTADALVNKSLELVSAPNTYLQLDTLIRDPMYSADDITAIINTDPALTTRLLKVVNSPYYGFPSQINTISRAITIIGTNELIQLVLATSVINAFKGIPSNLMNMDEFWKHSLACALTSSILAEKCNQTAREQFFIAGLLHNIGCLVMYQSVPELAREAINRAQFGHEIIYQAEQNVFGFDHTEVGEALSRVGDCLHCLLKQHVFTTVQAMHRNFLWKLLLSMLQISWSHQQHNLAIVAISMFHHWILPLGINSNLIQQSYPKYYNR